MLVFFSLVSSVVELSEADQFVIISTDGVWEFISSQEAVDFVCQKTRAEVQKAAGITLIVSKPFVRNCATLCRVSGV